MIARLIAGLALITAMAAAPAAYADPPAVFGVSAGPPSSLGSFLPGLTADYTTTTTVTVSSSANQATLTIADASGVGAPGHLINDAGTFSLPTALEASASSSDPAATGSTLAPIGATPLTLVTYGAPLSGLGNTDLVTIGLSQHINSSDALLTGSYGKALVLTLSTTSP